MGWFLLALLIDGLTHMDDCQKAFNDGLNW